MKRKTDLRATILVLMALLLVVCCGGLGFVQYNLFAGANNATVQAHQLDTVTREDLVQRVTLNGRLEAARSLELAFGARGRIAEVFVQPGATVTTGQQLARLETRDLELEVQQARAAMVQAQANYDKLVAGTPAEQVAAAEEAIAQARRAVSEARTSITPDDLAAARARVTQSEAALKKLQTGPTDLEQADSKARIELARQSYTLAQRDAERQRADASAAKIRAEAALEDSANALRNAQTVYSKAFWEWDYVQRTGYDPSTAGKPLDGVDQLSAFQRQTFKDALTQADLAVKNAERALGQAKLSLEQAQQDEVRRTDEINARLAQARLEWEQAQIAYTQRAEATTPDQIAAAEASLHAARADLQRLTTRAAGGEATVAEAGLETALARSQALERGVSSADLSAAQAQIDQSAVRVERAETVLAGATLRAPWAGVVAAVLYDPGAVVAEETKVLTLIDRSQLLLRGTVDEIDLVRLVVGQLVTVQIDALPKLALNGRLTQVAQMPEATQRDAAAVAQASRYAVLVLVERPDPQIRIGMAASGVIEVERADGALVIPRRALMEREGAFYVARVTGSAPQSAAPATEEVVVSVGLRTDRVVQILSGLSEHDQILAATLPPVPTTPEAQP